MKPSKTDSRSTLQPRLVACRVIADVLGHSGSLSTAFASEQVRCLSKQDQAFVKMLCFGTFRHIFSLQHISQKLLAKPIKTKEREIQAALLMGLYQLLHLTSIPPHAAVSTTVELTKSLRKPWAKGLLNAVMREADRQRDQLVDPINHPLSAQKELPPWLLEQIQKQWPDKWASIASESLKHPPMVLRVNQNKVSRSDYLGLLETSSIAAKPHNTVGSAIILESPTAVSELPGFDDGFVSIQDAAAQLAADLLDIKAGQRVLDACAAPGGKACHILEKEPSTFLLALDREPERLKMVAQNLDRLKLKATMTCADALDPPSWDSSPAFDRILVDAPCSGTGVIRRHPDIKWARKEDEIASFVSTQQQLLSKLWPLLKQEGILLYATCSILPQENSELVAQWLDKHPDAKLVDTDIYWGEKQTAGRQILPGEDEMDGFFYAKICKQR